MGATSSSSNRYDSATSLFKLPSEKAAFEKIVSELPIPREDPAYHVLLNTPTLFTQLTQNEVEYLNQEYGTTLVQNSLVSGNFRVLIRFIIHSLPLCCRMEKMSSEEFESAHVPSFSSDHESTETLMHQTLNALFLVRHFTMRFIEKQDECSLLAHFNHVPDYTTVMSRGNMTANSSRNTPSLVRKVSNMNEDLAFRFLQTLITVMIEFPPTIKTYDLHVEVLTMLLVLLSPVVYPRDHRKDADILSHHNPFLHMLMTSAAPHAAQCYWAHGILERLLQHYIDPLASPASSKETLAVITALKNTHETSLIKISETVEASTAEESDLFSYFTLEGIGSIASSIFRFPLSFYQYFVTADGSVSPIADRCILLLLVLLQSCRDRDGLLNPFRQVLSTLTNADEDSSSSLPNSIKISFSKLFEALGRKAPYETSHLLLYTCLYSNPKMHDRAITHCDIHHLLLPLLETLYHAKAIEPSRLYIVVIVLLTYTQNSSFIQNAHTKMIIHTVPWYTERYMLDISIGSLMMVIFIRLIYRNITHFQDSFIHLNAFAALSNLARYAQGIHMYAAQSLIGLIEMLSKMEKKFTTKIESRIANEDLIQKRQAYVEFIRLLLGTVSFCLKPELLPRNPLLIYSLVYQAETFLNLQRHPEFTQVNNYSVWNTLSKFQVLIESKTIPEETLDVVTVLELIQNECVSLIATMSSNVMSTEPKTMDLEEDASYRYEEEKDPEQFFIPYIWKLIYEQTPEFCWKIEKLTLFTTE